MKFTNEEYDQVIKEMSNRLVDIAYLKGEKTIREKFPKKFLEKFMRKGDSVEVNYGIQMIVNDLYQILGRIRRKTLKGDFQKSILHEREDPINNSPESRPKKLKIDKADWHKFLKNVIAGLDQDRYEINEISFGVDLDRSLAFSGREHPTRDIGDRILTIKYNIFQKRRKTNDS